METVLAYLEILTPTPLISVPNISFGLAKHYSVLLASIASPIPTYPSDEQLGEPVCNPTHYQTEYLPFQLQLHHYLNNKIIRPKVIDCVVMRKASVGLYHDKVGQEVGGIMIMIIITIIIQHINNLQIPVATINPNKYSVHYLIINKMS